MMKIDLSDANKKKRQQGGDAAPVQEAKQAAPDGAPTDAVSVLEAGTKSPRRISPGIIMAVLVGLVAVLVYMNLATITGFIGGFMTKDEVVETPPATAPAPVAPKEPDPTFVVISEVSRLIPARVWLTAAVVGFDGAYEFTGLAFSYPAMGSFIDALGTVGGLTSSDVPPETPGSDTPYVFTVAGGLAITTAPPTMDPLPAETLADLADGIEARSEEFGVIFSRLPTRGETYAGEDMPFVLTGPYTGLKDVIAALCPPDGGIRVYRISILPSAPGRSFDRVQASFSVRSVPAQ